MVDSTLITCIHSALEDGKLLLDGYASTDHGHLEMFKKLRLRLRYLKTFVFSTRMLGADTNLPSFLARIEDTVRKSSDRTRSLPLDLNGRASWKHFKVARELERDIQSLEEEMEEWYITLMDSVLLQQSSSLTADEILKTISSISENLVDFHCFRWGEGFCFVTLEAAMEDLGEQMIFLKGLIHFAATEASCESTRDLLAQAAVVVVNAAYLIFTCRVAYNFDEEMCKQMQLKISSLVQKIKPIDPHVYNTYNQALCSTKLPRLLLSPNQNMDDGTFIAVKDFLDSLISNLWELLRLNSCVVSIKDQVRELYQGLRTLRAILKQRQHNNLHMWIKEDIVNVVADAGVLIFSLYQKHTEAEFGLQDLLEAMKIILAELGEKNPQPAVFNFPRTTQLGFVDFILEKLMELTSSEAEPNSKSHLQVIQEELVFLKSFFVEIVESCNEHGELEALWNRVLGVAYKMEDLIDHPPDNVLPDSSSTSLDSIIKDLGNIKEDVSKTFHGKQNEKEVKEITRNYSYMASQRNPSITNEVVGFHNEAESIIHRLRRGSSQLRMVAIVGMPGLGKTTLAAKVFNDPSILHHFSVRARSTISQLIDKKRVLLELLNQIDPNKCCEMTEHDLADRLRRCLKRRRYLIFLDDMWEIKAWDILKDSFPNDDIGSRIILTSRHYHAAPHDMLDQEPQFLNPLNKDESMELLQRKLFPGNSWPPALCEIGMQICESCKGLPLTIVIIAGLLVNMEPGRWKEILDGLKSGIVSTTEHCSNTLELSYRHLPDHLRSCLLYFGAFPEDQEISVRKLLRLWIAEGFVQKAEGKNQVDVAEDYLQDLIERSLVMVAKERSIGGVKACRIHDLLHDFCQQKAKAEHFLHFLKGNDELLAFNEPYSLRRLCILSEPKQFIQSKLFCPRAHSLIFNSSPETPMAEEEPVFLDISIVAHIFKHLRVLDLLQIQLRPGFPIEVELLVQLVFLAIQGEINNIPSLVASLSKLETFIVISSSVVVSLPDSIWDMQKLKYLYLKSGNGNGGSLPVENIDNSSVLSELDSFSGAFIPYWDNMESLLRKFPNIRKLKCTLFQYDDGSENLDQVVIPDFLRQLESLHVSRRSGGRLLSSSFEFHFPANLKKLTLSDFYLTRRNLAIIGELPNLEVLRLLCPSFVEAAWEMKEGEFLKLRILTLRYPRNLFWWRTSDDQFDCLQKLVLFQCEAIKEMPSCLESIPTLETIEARYCANNVVELVRRIEEEQINWGNSGLKVIIQSFK